MSESTQETTDGFRDVDEMTVAELREEYQEVNGRLERYRRQPDTDSADWQRHLELWEALEERADVDIPECENCGATKWRFDADFRASCGECNATPDTAEKAEAIQSASEALIYGGEDGD